MDELLLIYNGRVEILVNDNKVNELRDGQFIGEMSFLTNHPASAAVKAILPTKYIAWKQKDLKDLKGRNPAIVFSLQSAMGMQMSLAIKDKNLIRTT
jgi:CRP-like cAMP-binding protein